MLGWALLGVTTMPPLFLDLFAALARRMDVGLYLLAPAASFVEGRTGEGHPLVDACGALGRDFFAILRRRDDVRFVGHDGGPAQGKASLLGRLQAAIAADAGPPAAAMSVGRTDGDVSLAVHCCHGPQREVEVLHDTLLSLFEADETLTPRDVIVMAPDISTYAPYVDAVFGRRRREPGDAPPIPYAVSDRRDMAESRTFQALLALLRLPTSRFKVTEILDLLAVPAVSRAFRIGDDDVTLAHRWAADTGIHWGWDGQHRGRFDVPPVDAGTWRLGLDRLLAGYAIAPDVESPSTSMFDALAPYADVEGDLAAAAGRLVDFVTALHDTAALAAVARRADEWAKVLSTEVVGRFFEAPDDATGIELARLRRALQDFARDCTAAGVDEPLVVDVVGEYLKNGLGGSSSGAGFCRGRVTFCSLVPMRSIPARVICLLGMNDGEFPRRDTALGFDRVARDPRAGDRSRRADDRYLFLEALLAARDVLYLSYRGRDRKDNSRLAPAVVVRELYEALGGPQVPGEIEHRLQAFNREYFVDDRPELFSYSRVDGEGARRLVEAVAPPPFFDAAGGERLPAPGPDDGALSRLTPERLARFIEAPCAFLLRERLGVRPPADGADGPSDSELGDAEGLPWRVRDKMIDAVLRRRDEAECWTWIAGMGWLTEDPLVRRRFAGEWRAARAFAEQPSGPWGPLVDVLPAARPLSFVLDVGGEGLPVTVTGTLPHVVAGTAVGWRYAKPSGRQILHLVVRHLCAPGLF